MNSEMKVYQEKLKKNIYVLIEKNRLEEAKELVNQYENIISDDIDVYSIKGVIAIMEGNEDEAECILIKGLEIQPFNFDILYNLAYLYETNKKYITAYRYYTKALKVIDGEIEESISSKLDELEKIEKVKEYISRKKVLFIAHIFPPSGGSGIQRSLKFVKYLREFGWEPIVVTVGNTKYNLKDETMISEIPEEVEVIRIDERVNIDSDYVNKLVQIYLGVVNDNGLMEKYINELNKSQEHLSRLLIQPDAYILWATEVLDKIDDKVDFEEIDMVYTTSGPYSDHIIGYYLKQKYNKPWVADFRDEWTNNPYVNYDRSSISYKINYVMENNIVNKADSIIAVTPTSKLNYEKIFCLEANKAHEITNGYDEEDFNNLISKKEKNDKFTIVHNGLLYMIRTPETFLKAITNLIKNGKINKSKINVLFPLIENEEKWKEYIMDNDLVDVVKITGYLNHKESLDLATNSDLLLLIIGSGVENRSVYTGKVFEYLRLCKPILSLSPKESLVEKLIDKTNRGKNFEFDDIQGIEDYILEMYIKWENGLLCEFQITEDVREFERKRLTSKLSDIFNKIMLNISENKRLKIINREMLLEKVNNYIKNNDFKTAEKIILRALSNNEKDYELLTKMGNLYFQMGQYYLSYKFYSMAIKECNYSHVREKMKYIMNSIFENNINNVEEFQRLKKYNFIMCGNDIFTENINLLETIGIIKGVITNYSDKLYKKRIELENLNLEKYDYIILLEKDKIKSEKIINALIDYNINPNKIFNFYLYPYPYFIEGFETRLNEFLKKEKVEVLITGLSYAEVGIDCDKLSMPSCNISLSGQDIFYDYHMTKYLLKFNSVKNNIKQICICMGYYTFDYDLSLADNAFTRINRYYYTLGETHHYDNVINLKLCNSIYKNKNYEQDYLNYHKFKLNTVLKCEDIEQEKVAQKQANMNYPETIIENKYIFEMYLKMLLQHDVKVTILILPTSKYYYKYFNNNYQKNKFYEIINEFKKIYAFNVIDYFDSELFKDEDFWDYSHLNQKGALKFTNILEEKLFEN